MDWRLARRLLAGATGVDVPRRRVGGLILVVLVLAAPVALHAQTVTPGFSIDQVLGAAFPYGLVAAAHADRIAWMQNERGMRNVYTAVGPRFEPVRLTRTMEDDGIDLTSLQMSSDGSVVVFLRGHSANPHGQIGNQSGDAEGGRREVWAANTTGARPPWRVTSAPDARMSPDGASVLYVRDGQVYRAAVDPGSGGNPESSEAEPLFVTLGTASDPVWSPDGKKIAFVTSRYDQRRYFPTQGAAVTHSFVAVYDLASRSIAYMMPSVDRDSSPVWSPDGTRVAFLRRPGLPYGHFATAPLRSIDRDDVPEGFLEARFAGGYTVGVWVADVSSAEAREVWHNPPGDTLLAGMNRIYWSGERLLFESDADNWTRWYSVPVSGPSSDPTLLTPGEGEVEHAAISSDGQWLYYTSNVGDWDRRHLWRVPVGGGNAEQLTRGSTIETVVAVPGSGELVAVLQAGPRQPVSVAVFPSSGGEGRIVGPPLPVGFPAARHVVPEVAVIEAADGGVAHSIVLLPPGYREDRRYPALLYVHGGGGRSVLGYPDQSNGFYHMSYAILQYFANKGYIVAAVNYRGGSALYGRAFREAPNARERGNSEYMDVLAAGRWLAARPDVDTERLGVWGLSYGGWLTGQALSRNSDLFKAGMIFAGVQMRSTSLDPEDLAYQSSPAYNIDKWTSPTLVIHGDDDRNVEFSQTVGLVQLFRARGVPHEVIVYPDDTHYFMRFSRWLRAFHAVDDFFDRTLIRKEALVGSGRPEGG